MPEPAHNIGDRGKRRTKLGVCPGQTPCPGKLRVLRTQHRMVLQVLNTQHCAQGMDGQMDGWIDGGEQDRHNPCPHGVEKIDNMKINPQTKYFKSDDCLKV